MKIIYVTASLPFGKGEAFVISEVKGLRAAGHDVWMAPMHPRGPRIHRDDTNVLAVTLATPLFSVELMAGALREFCHSPGNAASAFMQLFGRIRLSSLIKNLAVYPKGLWLAQRARRMGVDHIHAHWATATASMAMVASRVSGIPWSFTAHRYDIVENNLLAQKIKRAQFARFISRNGRAMALERVGAELANRTLVLHMGVDIPEADRTDQFSASSQFVVLCAANLIPVKGHRYLIEAAGKLRDRGRTFQVWLAGDGPLRAELELQAQEHGLQQCIKFLGQIPHDQLMEFYRNGSVTCTALPSLDLGGGYHEGIPVSLMEAMAHRVPVVATRTGGIPELLEDGAGTIVPPADADALADALELLMAAPDYRAQVAEFGYRTVVTSFSSSAVVHELIQLFIGAGAHSARRGR